MSTFKLNTDPRIEDRFKNYPNKIRPKLTALRKLVIQTAKKTEHVDELEETLKWGEPSFLAKKGSTIRMDWKAKNPEQYAIYFKCTSKLVPTFKEIHGDLFKYENNRAILFDLDEKVPKKELQECIELALTYHHVKHLPRLGK